MRVLVLGASGQVGHCLVEAGRRRGLEVTGTYRAKPLPGLLPLDLTDAGATTALVREARPDWVINCATWAWVDGNELDPERAARENILTARHAAEAARATGARLCYFSSSYVFDGRQAEPYTEDDRPSPISVYGETKVRAEELSRETAGAETLILRTVVVYGPDPQKKNFFWQVLEHGRAGREMRVPADQYGNPTFGPDLAAATLELLARGAGGIWNAVGPDERLSRVDFARLICRAAELRDDFLRPTLTAELRQPAPRPLNGALSPAKLFDSGIRMSSAAEILARWREGRGAWTRA